jgi:hypothetical protein
MSMLYQDDKERWNEIGNLRNSVARHLQVPRELRVLSVLLGKRTRHAEQLNHKLQKSRGLKQQKNQWRY